MRYQYLKEIVNHAAVTQPVLKKPKMVYYIVINLMANVYVSLMSLAVTAMNVRWVIIILRAKKVVKLVTVIQRDPLIIRVMPILDNVSADLELLGKFQTSLLSPNPYKLNLTTTGYRRFAKQRLINFALIDSCDRFLLFHFLTRRTG